MSNRNLQFLNHRIDIKKENLEIVDNILERQNELWHIIKDNDSLIRLYIHTDCLKPEITLDELIDAFIKATCEMNSSLIELKKYIITKRGDKNE